MCGKRRCPTIGENHQKNENTEHEKPEKREPKRFKREEQKGLCKIEYKLRGNPFLVVIIL